MTTMKVRTGSDALLNGFTAIGGTYHGEKIYVPLARENELAAYLHDYRAARAQAEIDKHATPELKVSLAAKLDEQLADIIAVAQPQEQVDPVHTFNSVPCVSEEDVLAQKKSAESNMKFSERERTNAVKAVTKALMARPLTRKIGMPPDVDLAMHQLAQVAPHMPKLVDALRIALLVAAATGAPPMIAPILLVGGAGVGKSHAALQIASLLGVPAHTVSYAASGSVGNMLSGADKNWGNSSTGIVFNALAEGDFANPVVVLDEIDKASTSSTASGPDRHPLNELLGLLEPVTAKEHKDRCAEIRVDARHIVWIATANSLEGLSAPLLSRFKVILINKPDARASVMIALSVASGVTQQMGATLKPPSGEVLQFLATLTPRTMRLIWTDAAAWATACGREQVTIRDIEQSIGREVVPQNRLH